MWIVGNDSNLPDGHRWLIVDVVLGKHVLWLGISHRVRGRASVALV